ncbi:prepilin-type N-terminal cleavage/methylation domain-containing protein [Patescibacteria group bacterium]|nr:prepilin-type N-terminal cleavage/methylation domain-containing protein [Patescibacteria group bacterium]
MLSANIGETKLRGFTLIELLIVILIIGVLSGLLIKSLNVGGTGTKARDAQRQGDLHRIQTALEMCFDDNRVYPDTSDNWVMLTGSDTVYTVLVSEGYIINPPVDPVGEGLTTPSSPCDASSYEYYYRSNGSTYYLTALMEVETSAGNSPCSNYAIGCVGSPPVACYAVKNP